MQQAEILCKQYSIATLYLFTPVKQAWYLKLGWERLEATIFSNHPVTVMKKNVTIH